MKPIPQDARVDDPRWEIPFLDLAHGLVMVGTKAKIIRRFTGLPARRVRELYKALRGINPPAGPVMQGTARFFAMPSKHTSAAWSLQTAIFLACYDRIGRITETPLHRGWRLLGAFSVYLSLTEKLHQATSNKRLDINQAYALLAHCSFMAQHEDVELQRTECPNCLIAYPVVMSESLGKQHCPICAMNANNLRLAAQASRLGVARSRRRLEGDIFPDQDPTS